MESFDFFMSILAFKQTFEWPVEWDGLPLMWHHFNVGHGGDMNDSCLNEQKYGLFIFFSIVVLIDVVMWYPCAHLQCAIAVKSWTNLYFLIS